MNGKPGEPGEPGVGPCVAEDQQEHKQRRPQEEETQSQVLLLLLVQSMALSASPSEPWTHVQLFQLGLFLLHTLFTVIRLQLLSSLLRSEIRLLVGAVALTRLFQV